MDNYTICYYHNYLNPITGESQGNTIFNFSKPTQMPGYVILPAESEDFNIAVL
jgi:hypothetical protein